MVGNYHEPWFNWAVYGTSRMLGHSTALVSTCPLVCGGGNWCIRGVGRGVGRLATKESVSVRGGGGRGYDWWQRWGGNWW